MSILFAPRSGQVVRILSPTGAAYRLAVRGLPPGTGLIAQSCRLTGAANAQFVPTLSNKIFVYVFGHRMGELTIGGVAVGVGCSGEDGTAVLRQFFSANNVSTTGAPIPVRLGNGPAVPAFLVGASVDISNAQTNVGSFSLSFRSLP